MAGHDDGLAIRVLGPLEATVDGTPLVVDTRKALAILALAAAEGRPFARDELAALLWPESDDESARGALRRTLSVLRTALGGRWLGVDRTSVTLDDNAWIDLRVVDRAIASGATADLVAAAAVARGPFLAGFSLRDSVEFDEWRVTRAAAVERTVALLLDRLADALEAAGDAAGAAAAAGRRIELDPLDEAAHRRLMSVLARSGDRAGAVRQYRVCVAALERELGVAPLAETTSLYEAIRDGRLEPAPSPAITPVPVATAGGSDPAAVERAPTFVLPLVGRAAQLDQLRAVLASVTATGSAGGRVVAVTGEAGIGKSRLVETVAQAAAASGAPVITARAYAAETGIAYGTITDLLRAGLQRPDAVVRLQRLPERAIAELGRLVDLPAPLAAIARRGGEAPVETAGHARLLTATVEALTALVSHDADPVAGPGLVVVEDIHWTDDASREALGWLSRRLDGRPIALLLTWRPEDLDELGLAFASSLMSAGADEIPLGRLDGTSIAELVRAAIAAGLQAPDAPSLLEASEGLPLFVAEALLSAAAPEPGRGGATVDTPGRSVRALLRERLASVGETASQVLAAGAVLGRSFDLGLVRGVSGRSEDETLAALEELERRGLVREARGTGPGPAWDFAHARLREAAYDATSLARRQILHRRAADLLRSDPATRGDPGGLVQLAGHELAAGRGAEAATAYADAGLAARSLHANREAAAHLEAAIALGHPDPARLQLALGDVRTALGDYRGAIAALEASAAVLSDAEQPLVELALGRAQARRGDLGAAAGHLDEALARLDAAREGPAANEVLARALVERAAVAQRAGDGSTAVSAASRALELAERSGDTSAAAAAHRVLGLAARDAGDATFAEAALERSLSLAVEDPDDGAAIASRNALALVVAANGRPDEAVDLLEAALAACRRTGERHLEAAIENNLADVLHAAGRGDEAMAHLKRAVAIFAELGGHPGDFEPEIWKLVSW